MPFIKKSFQLTFIASSLALIVACGNGGGGSGEKESSSETPSTTEKQVSGVVVVPQSLTTSAATVMSAQTGVADRRLAGSDRSSSATCDNIPAGYTALENIEIEFLDSGSTTVATMTTDNCGSFSGQVPESAVTTVVRLNETEVLDFSTEEFEQQEPKLVSTLPDNASLVISVMQDLGSGRIALTVTDSASGKAVLGLNKTHFGFELDNTAALLDSLNYAASASEETTVSIVLDASGSMGTDIYDEATDEYFEAIQIASFATHNFLDGLISARDEVGLVLFDDKVQVMNNAVLAEFDWLDADDNITEPYSFSESGLTSTFSELRPLVDLYNQNSAIYSYNTYEPDPVHADTGDLKVLGRSPWMGLTAFYDATLAGLDLVKAGTNGRRLIVAMTDGFDNSSDSGLDEVINAAVAEGVPVYAIGFGDEFSVDEAALERLAGDTGGEYTRVEGTNLTGLFQSIQTGVRFQYVADLDSAPATGNVITATVNYAGGTASRELTITR